MTGIDMAGTTVNSPHGWKPSKPAQSAEGCLYPTWERDEQMLDTSEYIVNEQDAKKALQGWEKNRMYLTDPVNGFIGEASYKYLKTIVALYERIRLLEAVRLEE